MFHMFQNRNIFICKKEKSTRRARKKTAKFIEIHLCKTAKLGWSVPDALHKILAGKKEMPKNKDFGTNIAIIVKQLRPAEDAGGQRF